MSSLTFALFLLFGVGAFSLSLLGHKNYQSTTMYALAIGGVVNANYFNAVTAPIECFGLPFGIDSLIYTLFAFCVMVMLLNDTKKSAYLLAISSVIAILFSAFMELIAVLFASGSSADIWVRFASFMISAFASIVAVCVTVEIIDRIKNKYSPYVCMALGITLITILNSGIYYPLSLLIASNDRLWVYVGTSFIGKAIALVYSVVALKILNILKARSAQKEKTAS